MVQQTKTFISDCYVEYAIPIRLLDEDWFIWLCEAEDEPVVVALNFESVHRHTKHFDAFLEAFVEAYGPAHSYWHTCHNVNRDEPANWAVMRYEPPSNKAECGPGVYIEPPLDLRREVAPG